MDKIAVLMAEGYEEGETLAITDLLRRCGLDCRTVSFGDDFVRGMHGMLVRADFAFSRELLDTFDAVVLPGGRPGGENLRKNPDVIRLVQKFDRQGKIVAAMCSGTLVLAEAKIIDGRRMTGYTGYAEKLPVAFLSAIASEKQGSTNSVIASCILEHLDEMQTLSMKEMAQKCNVGTASLSRFCRDIGLSDFAELKELLTASRFHFERSFRDGKPDAALREYAETISDSIFQAAGSVRMSQVRRLCADLHRCRSAADTLILIFSYTGSYFEYPEMPPLAAGRPWPRIWMISGQKKEWPRYVSDSLVFSSRNDQAGHPYQLLLLSGLIAQTYAALYVPSGSTAAGGGER